MFDVELNIDEILNRGDLLQMQLRIAMRNSMTTALDDGVRTAINTRKYQDRTAQLTASVHHSQPQSVSSGGAGVEGELVADDPIASYVNNGTRAHKITGDPLVFQYRGRKVVTKEVNHPGTKADGFMDRGADRVVVRFVTAFEDAVVSMSDMI